MKQIQEKQSLQWLKNLTTRYSDGYLIIEYQDRCNHIDSVKINDELRLYLGDYQFSELIKTIKQVLCEQIIRGK